MNNFVYGFLNWYIVVIDYYKSVWSNTRLMGAVVGMLFWIMLLYGILILYFKWKEGK